LWESEVGGGDEACECVRAKAACIKGSIFGEKLLRRGKERMKIKAKTIHTRHRFRRNGKRYWI
jgi:hypothetical protein